MVLQTCKRCRKRRVKCDLDLPSCGNCRLADVECLFYDESLGQEVPRSYLLALGNKIRQLESEIKSRKSGIGLAPTVPISVDEARSRMISRVYHLILPDSENDVSVLPTITYVGPGSSASLLCNVLKIICEGQILENVQASSRLQPIFTSLGDWQDEGLAGCSQFRTVFDPKKHDTVANLTPSVQRALIEHYHKVVHPLFPLLSNEQSMILLNNENPLRQFMGKGEKDQLLIHAVFSISGALVVRDLEKEQSTIARVWSENFHGRLERLKDSNHETAEDIGFTVIMLCFLAIHELIEPNPTTNQLWSTMGNACGLYLEMCEKAHVVTSSLGEEHQRVGTCLYALESIVSGHFRRPSIFCNTLTEQMSDLFSHTLEAGTSPVMYQILYKINREICNADGKTFGRLENLIPSAFRVNPDDPELSLSQALIYLALHPVFTSSFSDFYHGRETNSRPSGLIKIISNAARTVIDTLDLLNKERNILSLWLRAEDILQAGTVWGLFLIMVRRNPHAEWAESTHIRMGSALNPLFRCSSLLTSFAERWKGCLAYVEIWNIFLQLLWEVLE